MTATINPGNDKNRQIVLIDGQGNEGLSEVLFILHLDNYDKSCMLLYPAAIVENEDVEVQAFSCDVNADGDVISSDLYKIESDKERATVQGVLNIFLDDDCLSGE